jgi:hypothetical protein
VILVAIKLCVHKNLKSVHLKIYKNFACMSLNVSGFVRAHHSLIVKSTISTLLDTVLVRLVKRPKW